MRHLRFVRTLIGAGFVTLACTPVSAGSKNRDLQIVAIDVEGGGGTLLVTPEGKSLLLDAGWPTGMGNPAGAASGPTSADRILAAAKAMGLTRIDYLLVTHYHADHVGGVPDLLARFPVGTVIDHEPNLEPPKPGTQPTPSQAGPLFQNYEAAMRGRKRMIVRAGDRLQVGSLRVDVTNAAGRVLAKPLTANAPAVACPRDAPDTGVSDENDASIGIVATFGRARIASLGDITQKVDDGVGQDDARCVRMPVGQCRGRPRISGARYDHTCRPRPAAAPDLATKAMVEKACSDCHKFTQVSAQHKIADQWGTVVDRMISMGAPVSDAEAPRVVAYLARNYGPVGTGKRREPLGSSNMTAGLVGLCDGTDRRGSVTLQELASSPRHFGIFDHPHCAIRRDRDRDVADALAEVPAFRRLRATVAKGDAAQRIARQAGDEGRALPLRNIERS